ncbi:hypothetical protein [Roseateles sp. BYS87W]|uniref:Uncharacterized protein n=1 Tax=Pelomonas baiyunensis TaxID=3299026 RepID=A0ABW7GUL8_9BURK
MAPLVDRLLHWLETADAALNERQLTTLAATVVVMAGLLSLAV